MRVFFPIFLFMSFFSLGQQHNDIRIIDSITDKPVPSVKMYTDQGVFYSNTKGTVKADSILKGTIWVNKIGYQKKWLRYNSEIDTIYMLRNDYFLEAHSVSGKLPKDKTYEVGYHKEKHFFRKTLNMYRKSIVAVYTPQGNPRAKIEKIFLRYLKLPKEQNFKVYLFEVNQKGKPDSVLYQKMVMNGKSNNRGEIDISTENIRIPEKGIFIGIEWLVTTPYSVYKENPDEYGIRIHVTDKVNSNLTYILLKDAPDESNNNIWSEFIVGDETLTPCLGLEMRIE